jgi:hypothetical protein
MKSPVLCYLCGKALGKAVSRDHVPPKQLYADEVRRGHQLSLLTLPVHPACNLSYQHDEDYFVYSLVPFGRGSYAGDAVRRKILDDCKHPEQRRLLGVVMNEFERQPSGLVLPPGRVAKRFQGHRVLRVAWKIVRGLYFSRFGKVLEEDAPRHLEIVPPGEMPPESFFVLSGKENHGKYPGVFDYTFAAYPNQHNFNYCAMLLWDRIILTMGFQGPACDCAECLATFGRSKFSAAAGGA